MKSGEIKTFVIKDGVPHECHNETRSNGASRYIQVDDSMSVPQDVENFDELGNNPAFDFLNDPGEDIYEE